MKRFSYFTLLLFTTLLLCVTACEDNDDTQSSFKVVKTTIDSDPAALIGEIELSDANFTYEVSGGDWCEVTKDGKILTLKSGANYDFQNRTVEVVVLVAGKKYRVPVTQNGIVFELTDKTRNHFNVSFSGGERIIDLLTNIQYEVIVPDSCKDWISVVDLGSDSHTIVVGTSTKRRNGEVVFKYLEKTVGVTISQFDYMSYAELLGPALMIYTNSKGERIETDIILEERVVNETFTLKGTFESEIPRELPLYFLDDETHNGELRFKSFMLSDNFEDAETHANIKRLWFFIYARVFFANGNETNPYRPTGTQFYYPATFIMEGTGTRFKFEHSSAGIPNPVLGGYRLTQGMIVVGTNTSNTLPTGVTPYDTLFDIEIFKE